jgi:hypothetical protein
VPGAGQVIPATLHASLMARLDRLGSAKDVARVAAAIGREFSYELLAAVADVSEHELTTALDRLADSGLVFREGTPPNATYLFKHALVRDAAYSTLLRETRKQVHARIGANLEEIFPNVVEAQPHLLAYHFAEGALPEKAVDYWLKAAKQSVNRATVTEALSHLNKGLALLSTMADNTWRRSQELSLQIVLASTLMLTLGGAAPAVGEVFGRARQLWEDLKRPTNFEPRLPLFWHYFLRAEFEMMNRTAMELVEAGTARDDVAIIFLGNLFLAETNLHRADFIESRRQCEHSLTIFDPMAVSRRMLYNGRVGALVALSRALFYLGYARPTRSVCDGKDRARLVLG